MTRTLGVGPPVGFSADMTVMGSNREEWQQAVAKAMPESELQDNVVGLAVTAGWELVYHPYDSRRSNPGYPDLTLCRPPRIVWVELKTQAGRFEPEQPLWLDGLLACGAEVYVWRPQHWLSGAVEHVLTSRDRFVWDDDNWLRVGGWDPSLAVGKTKKPRGSGRRGTVRRTVR